jgi:HAD superfamily phosphatase (TIGR01668 family)
MLKKYFPDLYIDEYNSIDFDNLKSKGIKGLIFDIDNTLVATHTKEPSVELINWIETVKSNGFKVCIVSNASKQRVELFNKKMSLFSISRAKKPLKFGFLKASKIMEVKPSEVAVVGDQIFCDISGGNKVDMMTILVKPIHKKELWFVRLKRIPEKFILLKYNNLKKNGCA